LFNKQACIKIVFRQTHARSKTDAEYKQLVKCRKISNGTLHDRNCGTEKLLTVSHILKKICCRSKSAIVKPPFSRQHSV